MMEERPNKSLPPVVSGRIRVRSSRNATSGGIFPKAIRSLRRKSSFVENGPDILGHNSDLRIVLTNETYSLE